MKKNVSLLMVEDGVVANGGVVCALKYVERWVAIGVAHPSSQKNDLKIYILLFRYKP